MSAIDWQAVGVSLRLAACTTAILCAVGLPLAYWLATSRWRGKFLFDALVALPLLLPPTVLGFYILFALGPLSPLGRAWEALTGGRLVLTFKGLLLASVLYNFPFAVRPFAAAFAGVDRRLVEASWCLGVSRPMTFFRVVLPLARNGLFAGVVLCFAHTIGEFGVALMVGGRAPGSTLTLSIAVYDDVQAFDYAAAGTTSLLLLGLAFVTLAVVYALQGRVSL
jgi:molybdate transport system permease protein